MDHRAAVLPNTPKLKPFLEGATGLVFFVHEFHDGFFWVENRANFLFAFLWHFRKSSASGIQINLIFNMDIDIANFEKSISILILLSNILLNIDIAQAIYCPKL